MASIYTFGREAVQQIADVVRREAARPRNPAPKQSMWPRGTATPPQRFYRLIGANYIYRGSHPDGIAAEEVKVAGIDHGRIVWETIREVDALYCGSNGVYVQRDSGRIGNDPGDPSNGGDPDDPVPCPPNCIFTGNGAAFSTEVTSPPDWWFTGSAAAEIAAGANATVSTAQVYAVTGQRLGGYDFTTGSWETQWVGVLDEDLDGGSFANVTIDGIGSVPAFSLCTDGVSEGSTVLVIWRELAGIGGFAIVGRVCCVGYDA